MERELTLWFQAGSKSVKLAVALTNLEALLDKSRGERLPVTIAARTRRVYDLLAAVYPVSSMLFHARAHKVALEFASIEDGQSVLEIAVGSGEMFSQVAAINPKGRNIGIDISPAMAAVTQRRLTKEHPDVHCALQAVDCRAMPFRTGTFDHVICCYLLELLSTSDIRRTLDEVKRILKPGGKFTLILIGQNRPGFNRAYRVASKIVPAFWGRQMDRRGDEMLRASGFEILAERQVQQWFYPSRVLLTKR